MRKMRLLCILLALCSVTWSIESYARVHDTPQMRAQRKAVKKQQKQMAKYYKAQRKAEKKQQKQWKKQHKNETRHVRTGF
jgi:hypothetical protein